MNSKIVMGIVIGIVVGLIVGLAVGAMLILPTSTSKTGTETKTNNQVQVSGNVPDETKGTLYFANLDGTFQASTSITNGEYTVLLVGGQSYTISNSVSAGYILGNTFYPYSDYNGFYVPLGVSTFTENLVPNT